MPRVLPDGSAQRFPHPAPEGQARQPLQRLQRGRVPRRLGADGGRARQGRADDHRDGGAHAPGLRDRLRRRDARRGRRRHAPRRAPQRLRQAADRPAADAQRAGRPLCGVRGGDDAGDAPRARLRRSPAPTRPPHHRLRRPPAARSSATRASSSAWRPRSRSTGCASAPPTTPSSRWSASAATGTWRSRGCPASTARRRWPRSGRARAT